MLEKIIEISTKIKTQNPLVLNITNDVTMDFIANGLLSIGASPIMSKASQEMAELIDLAGSVVVNLGTLDNDFVKLCHHVCDTAGQLNKPIILDPVGAGASRFRTETALLLLAEYPISIVRGNASEIMALAGSDVKTKGVDSSADSQHAVASAKILSQVHDTAIAISGKVDVIVDGEQFKLSDHGSQRMSLVTGMGCLLSSIVAAFHAVHSDRFDAAAAAMVFYSLCGERADSKSSGPASFKIEFIDTLHAW